MEQEFEQQVVMPELEKRKQKLAELRSMLGQPSATELERHRREHDAAQAAMRPITLLEDLMRWQATRQRKAAPRKQEAELPEGRITMTWGTRHAIHRSG